MNEDQASELTDNTKVKDPYQGKPFHPAKDSDVINFSAIPGWTDRNDGKSLLDFAEVGEDLSPAEACKLMCNYLNSFWSEYKSSSLENTDEVPSVHSMVMVRDDEASAWEGPFQLIAVLSDVTVMEKVDSPDELGPSDVRYYVYSKEGWEDQNPLLEMMNSLLGTSVPSPKQKTNTKMFDFARLATEEEIKNEKQDPDAIKPSRPELVSTSETMDYEKYIGCPVYDITGDTIAGPFRLGGTRIIQEVGPSQGQTQYLLHGMDNTTITSIGIGGVRRARTIRLDVDASPTANCPCDGSLLVDVDPKFNDDMDPTLRRVRFFGLVELEDGEIIYSLGWVDKYHGTGIHQTTFRSSTHQVRISPDQSTPSIEEPSYS